MGKVRKATTDAIEVLERLFYEGKPERERQLAEAEANDEVDRKIHDLSKSRAYSGAARSV